MRFALAALAAGLSATVAQAETVETAYQLVKGRDYVIDATGTGLVELANPSSVVTISERVDNDYGQGFEFRAAYTGTYHVRATPDPARNDLATYLDGDCKTGIKTLCRITPSTTGRGNFLSPDDVDWVRVDLRRGRTYTFTSKIVTSGVDIGMIIRNKAGDPVTRRVAGETATLSYRPKVSDFYFIDMYYADIDGGASYTFNVK